MKLLIRTFTVICYFLPFTFFLTTCNNGIELRFSYNQIEADINKKLEKEDNNVSSTSAAIDRNQTNNDTLKIDTAKQNISTDTIEKHINKSPKLIDSIYMKIMRPTNSSLSGIGSILLHKNTFGKITISIALFCSLILLIAFKFIKSKRGIKYLLLLSLLSLILFIIESFLSSVTVLWGCWTLLCLLITQFIIEFINDEKADR